MTDHPSPVLELPKALDNGAESAVMGVIAARMRWKRYKIQMEKLTRLGTQYNKQRTREVNHATE
jgi:hypothetical protein